MKRWFSILIAVAAVLTASPVLGATVFEQMKGPVDMKEPVVVIQLTDPAIPNPLWPGSSLQWSFRLENISNRDYWVQAYIRVTTEKEGISYTQGASVGGAKLEPYQAFLLRGGTTTIVTVTLTVDASSPVAQGIRLFPTITRVEPPRPPSGG